MLLNVMMMMNVEQLDGMEKDNASKYPPKLTVFPVFVATPYTARPEGPFATAYTP